MALTLSLARYTPSSTEQELVAAARDGSDRAFEELYSRYRERIAAFIVSKVHDHGRAEDIAQEVFMAALRRLRATDQEIAFKPWLYEIAKNACIDEFRRSRRSREVSLDADDELAGGRRGLLSIAPTPPAVAESKQKIIDLQGAFSGLSEGQHELLVLREFEGLSYDAIGERTGMSRQMVESTLFRARRKLSEEYDELASGRRCEQIQAMIEDGRAMSAGSIGVRERRRLTRHLSHCQPCRRAARMAGVDQSLVKPRTRGARIAALLPIPIWRWPWGRGGKSASAKGTGAKGAAVKGAAHASGAGSLQSAVAVAPASSIGLGQAAAALAALAIAGAGGGAVAGLWAGHRTERVATGTLFSGTSAPVAPVRHVTPPVDPAPYGVAAPAALPRPASGHHEQKLTRLPGAPGSHRTHPAAGGASHGAGAERATAPSGGAGGSSPGLSGTAGGTVGGTERTVAKVLSGARNTVNSVVQTTTGTVNKVVNGATGTVNQVVGGASGAVSGALNGTSSAVDTAGGGAAGAVNNTVAGATPSP